MAAAYTARQMGVPITIFVPTTTPQFIVDRLKMEVHVHVTCYCIIYVSRQEMSFVSECRSCGSWQCLERGKFESRRTCQESRFLYFS